VAPAHTLRHIGAAALIACAGVLAGGCASTSSTTSSLAAASPDASRAMALDALAQLSALYPPASTQFNLTQPAADPFGSALADGLRVKGYALAEPRSPAAQARGVGLGYVMDQVDDLQRVTLTVGDETLTRAYAVQNGAVKAGSAWTRKVAAGGVARAPAEAAPVRAPAPAAASPAASAVAKPVEQRPSAAAAALQPPPPPPPVGQAAVVPEKTWDMPARKAAGVVRGAWVVGDSPTLRAVVERWGASAGVRVQWDSKNNYPVTPTVRARGEYGGTFQEALMQMAGDFGQFQVPLSMTFATNAGIQTLRVTDAPAR
jgi:hypothetical protein